MMIGSWFSENSADRKKTAKKHCESVNVDLEETNKKQKERIQRDENWFMNNSRKEEKLRSPWIRFFKRGPDSVKSKVNGQRDTFVSEPLERLPLTNVFEVAKLFRGRFMGRVEAPYSCKTAAYLNAGRGRERGVWRTVLFYLRWCRPAVLRGRSSNGRMFPCHPSQLKTTQGVLLGAKQKVKGTRARRIECTRHKRCRDASSTCLPVPLHMLLHGILSSWCP